MSILEHMGAGAAEDPNLQGIKPVQDNSNGEPKMLEDGSRLLDTRTMDGVDYHLVLLPDGRRVTRVPMPEAPDMPPARTDPTTSGLSPSEHNWSVTVGQRVNGRLSLVADAAPGHEQFALSALQNISGRDQASEAPSSMGAEDAGGDTPSTKPRIEESSGKNRREQVRQLSKSIGNISLRKAVIIGGTAAYLFVAAPSLYKMTAGDNGDLISWGLPLPSIASPIGDVEWVWHNTLGHIF